MFWYLSFSGQIYRISKHLRECIKQSPCCWLQEHLNYWNLKRNQKKKNSLKYLNSKLLHSCTMLLEKLNPEMSQMLWSKLCDFVSVYFMKPDLKAAAVIFLNIINESNYHSSSQLHWAFYHLSAIVLVHSYEPCLQQQQPDICSRKALKTHCAPPAQVSH